VAVLDTGIDSNHPDLNIGAGYNALRGGKLPEDDNGHGTYMAGIIGATLNGQLNGPGIIGVAPQATVVPVKVLNQNGSGRLSDLLSGMQWVYNTDIRLANMSLQFKNHRPLEKATKRLYERGVIMVAAAGNHCSSGPPDEGGDGGDGGDCDPSETDVASPAAYSTWVIAVGATDYYNWVTAYSRSGQAMALGGAGGHPLCIRLADLSNDAGAGQPPHVPPIMVRGYPRPR
jgi:subtilisin family serine protease